MSNEIRKDKHGDVITWFVCRFPAESHEGTVMWEHEFNTKAECDAKCAELQKEFPSEHFLADDLEELEEVFQRDVKAVLEAVAERSGKTIH
jgi:hypothetical protein